MAYRQSSAGHVAGRVQLSEEAVWYGLHMLKSSGQGLRGQVKCSNVYERRLLKDVVPPQEAGSGFAEIGALAEAKTTLQEAVQLPLQHPHLFAQGSLAR